MSISKLIWTKCACIVGLSLWTTTSCFAAHTDDNDNATIRLVGVASITGETRDLSGFEETLVPAEGTSDDEVPEGRTFSNDMFGGISAIAWTGEKDLYWMLPDRGPLDGAVDWTCRIQKVRIEVAGESSSPIKVKLVSTIVLRDSRGIPFTGLASAFDATKTRTRRLDPEGIRVLKSGNVLISDEYGPRVIEFKSTGEFVQELQMPSRYLIANPDVSKSTENPKNVSGRATNRGMEGLAVTADGHRFHGLMQSPLLQDSFRETMDCKPAGLNCRMLSFDSKSSFGAEFVYQLDAESNKLNEILYCGPNQFVVIERDGESGEQAAFKKLMLISTRQASDVSSVEQLPRTNLPQEIEPVAKTELVDLLDIQWGLAGKQMPEKLEGLAFGPDIDDQHRLLLVASDNDFVPNQNTVIYAFAVPRSKLNVGSSNDDIRISKVVSGN
jgi:hypothetical protein